MARQVETALPGIGQPKWVGKERKGGGSLSVFCQGDAGLGFVVMMLGGLGNSPLSSRQAELVGRCPGKLESLRERLERRHPGRHSEVVPGL